MKTSLPKKMQNSAFVKQVTSLGKKKRLLLYVASMVAIVMAVIFIGLPQAKKYQQHRKEAAAQREARKNATPNEVSSSVNSAINNNSPEDALRAIEQNKEPDSKPNLILAATIYAGMHRYEQALQKLNQAESKYGLDSVVSLNIAAVKELKTDKAGAKEYYQKSIELLRKEKPIDFEQIIKDTEAKVKELDS